MICELYNIFPRFIVRVGVGVKVTSKMNSDTYLEGESSEFSQVSYSLYIEGQSPLGKFSKTHSLYRRGYS